MSVASVRGPPGVEFLVGNVFVKVAVECQKGGGQLVARHFNAGVLDESGQVLNVKGSVAVGIVLHPFGSQFLLALDGELEESHLAAGRKAHPNGHHAGENHPSSHYPIEEIDVGYLQGSHKEVEETTAPGKLEEFGIVPNAGTGASSTGSRSFQHGNNDTKDCPVKGNESTGKVEAKEPAGDVDDIGKNHGHTPHESHGPVRQGTLRSVLVNLLCRSIDKLCTGLCSRNRQCGVQQLCSFLWQRRHFSFCVLLSSWPTKKRFFSRSCDACGNALLFTGVSTQRVR